MQIYRTSKNNDLTPYSDHPSSLFPRLGIPVHKIAILDIETTGFNRNKDIISVVGIVTFTNEGNCEVIQLFNDDGKSDHKIIESLTYLLEPIELLVTYNGDGFDLPFVNHKSESIGMKSILRHGDNHHVQSLDLLKISRELFHYLPRKNLKTVEAELGIGRQDTIDGKEAAESYIRFLKTGNESERDKILLHNVEDILNLIPLLLRLHDRSMAQNPLSFPFAVVIQENTILVEVCHIEKDLLLIKGRTGYPSDTILLNAQQSVSYSWLFETQHLTKLKALDHMNDNGHIIMKSKFVEAEPFLFLNPFDDVNDLMSLKEDQLNTLITKVHGEWSFENIRLLSATLLCILMNN